MSVVDLELRWWEGCPSTERALTELRSALIDWKPQIVFNLLEEFNGIVTYDQHVVAFLELMQAPYTGCNPRGLLLSRDKVLCKQLLAFVELLASRNEYGWKRVSIRYWWQNMMVMRLVNIAQPSGSDQPAAPCHCTRCEWTRKSP